MQRVVTLFTFDNRGSLSAFLFKAKEYMESLKIPPEYDCGVESFGAQGVIVVSPYPACADALVCMGTGMKGIVTGVPQPSDPMERIATALESIAEQTDLQTMLLKQIHSTVSNNMEALRMHL